MLSTVLLAAIRHASGRVFVVSCRMYIHTVEMIYVFLLELLLYSSAVYKDGVYFCYILCTRFLLYNNNNQLNFFIVYIMRI